MKILSVKRLAILIVCALLLSAGCSSVDKARMLYREGKVEEALDMAEDLLDDGNDKEVRLGAIEILEDIGGKRAGKILMPVLNEKDSEVKDAAITAIGKIKYAPASKKLISIGMSSKGDTYEAAAGAIRDIGPPAIDLLVKRFSNTSSTSKQNQYKELMLAVGPSVASGIAKNLAGKTYFENRTNFELLIAFKSPEVATWLLKEIENEEVAENVMEGLVKLGRNAVGPVTRKLRSMPADSDNVEARVRLINVLGQLKAKQSVSLLEDLTRDNFDSVRDAADVALKRIRGF